jgi:type IV pilus assembly protein PilA
MRKLHTRKGGFTLIELMIVVAIIGILAAIAIPNFLRFQLRSRVGEGKTNIAAIRTAEESYNAEYGVYVAAVAAPATPATPTNSKRDWPATAPGFTTVGWFPEGEVYYNYAVQTGTVVGPVYTIEAWSDIDADGAFNSWGYVHAVPGSTTGLVGTATAGAACAATGTYNAVSGNPDLLNTTGPCSAIDGQSIF